MVELDRAVIRNMLALVPYEGMSPLFLHPRERHAFERWCQDDLYANAFIHLALENAPVFEWNQAENAFVVSLTHQEARQLVQLLVYGFENQKLSCLFESQGASEARGPEY